MPTTGPSFTGDVQLKIADAFMEEGEYYRAITEYKKFLILFPDSAKGGLCLLRDRHGLFQGRGVRGGCAVLPGRARKISRKRLRDPGRLSRGNQPMETEELRQGAGGAGDPRRAAPRVGICPPLARGDQSCGSR
ncbi:MAG: hypothetical protein MZU97_07675 [Bacillus subtilis]|nr:hypothetical protein [Bacillus subtilis]